MKKEKEENTLIPKELMHSLEEEYFKDCKYNYVSSVYKNDFKININKILKNNNLEKIEFHDIVNIEDLSGSISNLSNLTYLDVSMNELKSLAISIRNMKNLKQIDISYNGFIYIPDNLLGFDNLGILNLQHKKH